jgi:hypothetical protein
MGVSFSPGDACAGFFSERGLPMTKTIALSIVLAASLGLTACAKQEENTANAAANLAENAMDTANTAMNTAINASENAANAVSNMTNNAM